MIWTVKHIRDAQGFKGLSIMRSPLAIANMVMQLDDGEFLKARSICDAMNILEMKQTCIPCEAVKIFNGIEGK